MYDRCLAWFQEDNASHAVQIFKVMEKVKNACDRDAATYIGIVIGACKAS